MQTESWRVWNRDEEYGNYLFKRATGELEEMESAKALCGILSKFYQKGMKLVDIGCGAGHYLRSLKMRLDEDINYTGADATAHYIELAKKAFPEKAKFQTEDIFQLSFHDESFDIVTCNNVLLHLPPSPEKAIEELIRVSKKYVVIRTVFGERNYIIKEIRDEVRKETEVGGPQSGDTASEAGDITQMSYNFFNMYTVEYIKSIIRSIGGNLKMSIVADDMWESFDNSDANPDLEGQQGGRQTGTKGFDGKQVSGNLILDWRFIVLQKP